MTEEITPYPGDLIDVPMAAALCGVTEITVRSWINRGYLNAAGDLVKLAVERRIKHPATGRWIILLNPVEVAKADYATASRARRIVIRGQFPIAVPAA